MATWKAGLWGVGMVLGALATAAWAQEVEPVRPKPAPTSTQPHAQPPKKKPGSQPTPSATGAQPTPSATGAQPTPSATEPNPPSPTPEEQCSTAGGEWRNGQCDMARPTCLAAGKAWDTLARTCHDKEPAACPEGTTRQGADCVPRSTAPTTPHARQACEAGMKWNGEKCVAKQSESSASEAAAADRGAGSGGLRTAALLGGGVLLGAGVVTGILAFSKKASWTDQCQGKECYASAQSDYDAGKLMANISTGTFVAGAVLMTAGLFLIPGADKPADAPATSATPTVNVSAGPGGGNMSARWVF